MTSAEMSTILTAVGGIIAGILAAVVQLYRVQAEVTADAVVLKAQLAEAMDDIAALKHERDQLRQTLEQQTHALTEQSERLTYTVNQLAAMTLDRDQLARQVRTLTEENEALKTETRALQRRINDLEAAPAAAPARSAG